MESFSPIPNLTQLEHKKSPLYFSSCYHYVLDILRSGGKDCGLSFIGDQNELKGVATSLRNASEFNEMVDDRAVFYAISLLVEASKRCPDKKTRSFTLDELREFPEVFVCDSIVAEQFATVALHGLERDLEAGYSKLSSSLVHAIREGKSLILPIHHHENINTKYEDADIREPLSCASDGIHWTLIFAHCRSRGTYDIYHYDSLPYRSSLVYAFKVAHAMLDAVTRKVSGSPVVISSVHCSFSDRPAWPFPQIVPPNAVRSIENMSPQESGTSCGLFVIGYAMMLAIMRSPLKKSAVEQVKESFVKLYGRLMYHMFIILFMANTKS